MDVVLEGFLEKEGGGPFSRWQKRWFRLTAKKLSWYTNKPKDNSLPPAGSVDVSEIASVEKLVGDRAGKQHCFTLHVTGKKIYQLSASTAEEREKWVEKLNSFNSSLAQASTPAKIRFVTVEVFCFHGVRVTGEPGNEILADLGAGFPKEKKRSDERGWFCDRHVPLAEILNLFSHYGWELDRTYQSESVSSMDNTLQSCNIAVFCKGKPTVSTSPSTKSRPLSIPKEKSDEKLIEGADEELAQLMVEFNIPLDLLYISNGISS